MIIADIILGWLGLCFGSFVNALVWRLHEKKNWVKARSQCSHCGHKLAAKDLIPLVSWLLLRGKCRYCGRPIADSPLVELAAALIFIASYHFWPADLAKTGNLILLIAWLASSVGLLALLVYDLKWMRLPNNLVYSTALVAVSGQLIYLLGFAPDKLNVAVNWLLSVLVASGIFWLLFMLSNGKWIGYGDVRLGLITGTLLQSPGKSFLMIFLASVLGSLFVLPSLLSGKRGLGTKLPFGPFLIAAAAVCLLFGSSLINWYSNLFNL